MTAIEKGRLGVLVLELTPELRKHYGAAEDRGVLVGRVEALSPASAAGLQPGDVITEAGGRRIDDVHDLVSAVGASGASLGLRIIRGHQALSLSAKLGTDTAGPMSFEWSREMFRRFDPERPAASRHNA